MNSYWEKKALKRKGIKGEHAYLEAVEDFEKLLKSKIKKLHSIKGKNKAEMKRDFYEKTVLEELKEKYFKRK